MYAFPVRSFHATWELGEKQRKKFEILFVPLFLSHRTVLSRDKRIGEEVRKRENSGIARRSLSHRSKNSNRPLSLSLSLSLSLARSLDRSGEFE